MTWLFHAVFPQGLLLEYLPSAAIVPTELRGQLGSAHSLGTPHSSNSKAPSADLGGSYFFEQDGSLFRVFGKFTLFLYTFIRFDTITNRNVLNFNGNHAPPVAIAKHA